ncbi:hypothetical protein V2J56_08210 [Georgenia sp. MJ206]|uniref:hypothetical protein n=1 Tax=Georgenia wangjunii TaxID=3117730 RepID=UPI002F269D8E
MTSALRPSGLPVGLRTANPAKRPAATETLEQAVDAYLAPAATVRAVDQAKAAQARKVRAEADAAVE